MNYFDLAKFLHVMVGILWVGGASGMIVSGARAMRANAPDEAVVIVRYTKFLAEVIFMPASLVMLALGIFMTWTEGFGFTSAWIDIGIMGVVVTGLIGGLVLTPLVKKIEEAGSGDVADGLRHEFLRKARADMVLLWVIIWDMVMKPQWSDTVEIAAMAAVVLLGGLFFLRKTTRPRAFGRDEPTSRA